jgi:hypothetical protein
LLTKQNKTHFDARAAYSRPQGRRSTGSEMELKN